jgi:hypothetical protein
MVSVDLLVWPLLAQIGWTFMLYAWLTVARKRAVDSGRIAYSSFVLGRDEPLEVARITRNLTNQFELPAIFYAVVVLFCVRGQATVWDVAAAWVFVAGRIAHTLVQTLTDNVPLRGRVFTINFLALVVLVGHLAWLLATGAH